MPLFVTTCMFIVFQAAFILHVFFVYGMNNETRSVYNPCEQNYNLCMKSVI